MLAVASLGCKCTAFDRLIDIERAPNEPRGGYKSYLLQKIGKLDFTTALGLCKHADVSDLSSAFAELVASSILRPHSLSDMDPLAAAICTRGAALDEALTKAFDYDEYFGAMTKAALADFCVAAGDAGIKRSAAKKTLAAQLSRLAREKGWLPEPLKTWALMTPKEPESADHEPSLAQAMDEAISADEAAKAADVPLQKKKRGRKKQAEMFQ